MATIDISPLDLDEARAAGRRRREAVPRRSHAGLSLDPQRDPVAILAQQNLSRVPELVPVRMGRMADSPFSFFRGAAAVMAADLARTPISGVEVQACGDAHLSNFGVFASPERTLLFDVNDFDETLQAPWEWDVKRLAASAAVAARQNGFDDEAVRSVVRSSVRAYRERIGVLADMSALDVYYAHVNAEEVAALSRTATAKERKRLTKMRSNTSDRVLEQLTVSTPDGIPRIADQPPLLQHRPELEEHHEFLGDFLDVYRKSTRTDVQSLLERFRLVDVVLKVVGVGSVGTRCFLALLLDHSGAPLFLQVKEAEHSVLETHWKKTRVTQQGHRVVSGQQIMQAQSDVFLGWSKGPAGRYFYVRQFKDMKGSINVPGLASSALAEYLELCGSTLARAHAQSGKAAEITGYLGGGEQFDNAIVEFSSACADQNELDHQSLLDAVKAGTIEVRPGV